MSSKDFMFKIAASMSKPASEFQKYVDALEENFLETVDSLREVNDEQWRNDLKFPVGLINKIKKELTSVDVQMVSKPVKETVPS